MDTFERRRLGDLLTRLTGDVAAIESFVLTGVADLVSYVVRILVFATALVVLSWKLSIVAAVIAPLFWFAARFFSLRIKAASREKRRRSGALGAVAEESLGNAALVQAYNRHHEEAARYGREAEGAFRAQMAATKLRAIFTPVVDVLELAGALLIIGFGTYEQLTRTAPPVGTLRRLPRALRDAIDGALAHSPADRPGVRELTARLEEALPDEPRPPAAANGQPASGSPLESFGGA
jgi:ABC-type multidrug transport system fused ATPase/permease subunit